jgi:hypothetical protein
VNFVPGTPPTDPTRLAEYLARELNRFASAMRDDAETVFYRTLYANQGSLTAGVSANYKIASGNVIRISTSATVTLGGLVIDDYYREVVLLNVGTGVLVLKSEDTGSSASYRFALPTNYQVSANASVTVWRDPVSARFRAIGRT